MDAPNGCSIVLIAGKNLERVDDIMQKMDDIAEQMAFIPVAAFLIPSEFHDNVEVNSYHRNDYSPPMVNF